MSIVIPTLDLSTVASTSQPPSPTSSIFSVSTISRRRRKKKGGKLKARKECAECEKRRKAKISMAVCPYHRFRHTIINSSHENLRQVFIEICYDREFNTFNIVQFVARMLKLKGGLRAKGKIFVEDLCRFAMMGVRGKKLGNSYVAPETITTYLKNARLPFSLYKRHLHKGHFSLCIANGYPFQESLDACYGKKTAKAINVVTNQLLKRRNLYLATLAQTDTPPKLFPLILSYLD